MTVLDLFAGPGGWDLAARDLGIDPLGIEWSDAACATRRAARLRTIQADVSSALVFGRRVYIRAERSKRPDHSWERGYVTGLIGSPPCPTFSAAGGRSGSRLTDVILAALRDVAEGRNTLDGRREEARTILRDVATDEKARDRAARDADMSLLVVEPLRWALALEPEWIALEQVPPVLPIWRAVAEILRARGYSVWTGILEAERYGVPQTRERAILMASRTRTVQPPQATHQRYVPGEPARHEHTLEGDVLPWVSMAQALGMVDGDLPAPAPTVSGGGTQAGGGVEVFAGRDARRRVLQATQRNGSTGEYGERGEDEPAFTVAPNADRWMLRMGDQANATERDADAPAPTLLFGHRANRTEWIYDRPSPTIVTTRRSSEGLLVGRQLPPGEGRNVGGHGWVPSPTAELQSADWPERRPATTIAGDPRVFQPGGHHEPGQQSANAVRVTIEQASILQTFPPDYPWQGSRSAQYLQCGNAVPPLLARAILSMLVEPAESARAAA